MKDNDEEGEQNSKKITKLEVDVDEIVRARQSSNWMRFWLHRRGKESSQESTQSPPRKSNKRD
jgi:hypothetical protein